MMYVMKNRAETVDVIDTMEVWNHAQNLLTRGILEGNRWVLSAERLLEEIS